MKPRQPTGASRQGAKSGQVFLRDKGTPFGDPLSTPRRSPVPSGPEALVPVRGVHPWRSRSFQPRPRPPTRTRIVGLRCRGCGRAEPIGLVVRLSGLLRAARGRVRLRGRRPDADPRVDRARGRPGIWRYAELLPVDAPPARGLPVGSTPLLAADRLAPALGLDRLWIKDDTRNPSLSFKDRAVAVAAARAVEFGVEALACASTGNLAGATAAAAAALGLPAYVFIPADLEPAKVDHALAYGATVVPIEGTYDDVNRLCLEVADETGWGFVNINLRPFYAEGSKTLAFEIAESLGWRSPDVVVAPVASGRCSPGSPAASRSSPSSA